MLQEKQSRKALSWREGPPCTGPGGRAGARALTPSSSTQRLCGPGRAACPLCAPR